jgi:hypothetical protein
VGQIRREQRCGGIRARRSVTRRGRVRLRQAAAGPAPGGTRPGAADGRADARTWPKPARLRRTRSARTPRVVRAGGSGGGIESDCVAEGFELADVGPLAALGVGDVRRMSTVLLMAMRGRVLVCSHVARGLACPPPARRPRMSGSGHGARCGSRWAAAPLGDIVEGGVGHRVPAGLVRQHEVLAVGDPAAAEAHPRAAAHLLGERQPVWKRITDQEPADRCGLDSGAC